MKLFYYTLQYVVSSVKGCLLQEGKPYEKDFKYANMKINLTDLVRDMISHVLTPTACNNFLYLVLQGKLESEKFSV